MFSQLSIVIQHVLMMTSVCVDWIGESAYPGMASCQVDFPNECCSLGVTVWMGVGMGVQLGVRAGYGCGGCMYASVCVLSLIHI